ncbi:MAG: glycosyltransferase [Sulfurovum sp.]|nr:glycosyltransferase [Sulfurovum sp.]
MQKMLLMGPRVNKNNPSDTGGAVVLFENLLVELQREKYPFLVIDTNKKNYTNSVIAYLSIFFKLCALQFKVEHISLHSSRDYILLSPAVIMLGKVFGKTTSLRKFGGEAWDTYTNARGMRKKLLLFIFTHINVLFLEMKYLVDNFNDLNENTFWFPNVRIRDIEPSLPRKFNKKFIFVGHIKEEKGIDEILEVSQRLDSSYTIDIYGSISDDKYTKEYLEKFNIQYKGALLAQEVYTTLNKYNVLLLPSYKEGYPGIVIESYAMGLPVISTTLPGLKEIVEIEKTGILTKVKDVDALKEAILFFNEDNYQSMSESAYRKFREFNAQVQTELFVKRVVSGNSL